MSLFGKNSITSDERIANSREVMEMFFTDDLIRGTQQQIKEFCNSTAAQVLMEKAVLKKGTMMRLSKEDDLKRRVKIIAYKLAKEAKDPEWEKLKLHTARRKESIGKIMNKYGAKAENIAKIAQKKYISLAAKVSDSGKK